jgi:hypothetical protein
VKKCKGFPDRITPRDLDGVNTDPRQLLFVQYTVDKA